MKVSVVIPAYNAAPCLERAVQSVQAQTLQDFEILIIDDCSPDNTLEVAKMLAKQDKRIRVLQMAINGGPSAARNRGFDEAKGEWLAILDADDVYKPTRLEVLVGIGDSEKLDMVADNLELYDVDAKRSVPKTLHMFTERVTTFGLEFYLANDFSGYGYSVSIVKPMFRKAFMDQMQVRYPLGYRHGEDSYLYTLVLIKGGKAAFVDESLYVYTPDVGPFSGKRSVFSQTKVDFVKKAQSCADIRKLYGNEMSAKARALIEQRRRRNLDMHLLQLLKRRKPVKILAFIAKQPWLVLSFPVFLTGKILHSLRR